MNKRVIEEDDSEPELEIVAHKKKKKKRRNTEDNEAQQFEEEEEKEMHSLENLLFGSLYSPIEFGEEDVGKLPSGAFLDRRAVSVVSPDAENGGEIIDGDIEGKKPKPAWVDEDDGKTTVNIAKVNRLRKLRKEENETVISGSAYVARLRAHHTKLNPGSDWARVYDSDEESGVENEADAGGFDDILRTNERRCCFEEL